MTFLNAKKVIMVSACCLVVGAANLNCAISAGQKNVNGNAAPVKSVGGKKLTCPEMNLLNAILEVATVPVIRMDYAYKATLKVKEEIESSGRNDKAFIEAQIKSILAPVKQFFSTIHEYAGMVKPLVSESLLSGAESPEERAREESECLILRFFASKDDTDDFFSKNVSTKEDLIKACTEFTIFFEDIRMSLSEGVMKAYHATLEKLKNNHKQSTVRKPAGK